MIENLFWLPDCGFPDPKESEETRPIPMAHVSLERLRSVASNVSEATRGLSSALVSEDVIEALTQMRAHLNQMTTTSMSLGMTLHDEIEMRLPMFRPSGDTGRTTAPRNPEPQDIIRYDVFLPRLARLELGRSLFPVQTLPDAPAVYFTEEEE